MLQVLHASHNGTLYRHHLRCTADIADLIREPHLETLTSTDGEIDFWFTPSTEPGHQRANRKATEIFLATTKFSARNVPLLRGRLVLATHTPAGDLAGLTDAHMQRIGQVLTSTTWLQRRVLGARLARDERCQRRASTAEETLGGVVEGMLNTQPRRGIATPRTATAGAR